MVRLPFLAIAFAAALLLAGGSPSPASAQAPPPIEIRPEGPTTVGNCIPFANNVDYDFSGFVYRNIPPFKLLEGDRIRFDLGALAGQDARRDIYFAQANINPDPAVTFFANVVSQGVQATDWTQVVTDSQTPANPRGNTIEDDYELTYLAEAEFRFLGGGLIIGFAGSPPAVYADFGCEQVLVSTTSDDASGRFYSRFLEKPHLTTGVLDDLTGGAGSGVALGGVIIEATGPPLLVGGNAELVVGGSAGNGANVGPLAGGVAAAALALVTTGAWRLRRTRRAA